LRWYPEGSIYLHGFSHLWECEFNVQVRKTVESGEYPLLLTDIGENVERSDTIMEVSVQEENRKNNRF
jgi:hypothetical protein